MFQITLLENGVMLKIYQEQKKIYNNILIRSGLKFNLALIPSMWCNGSTWTLGVWGAVQIGHIRLTGKENKMGHQEVQLLEQGLVQPFLLNKKTPKM